MSREREKEQKPTQTVTEPNPYDSQPNLAPFPSEKKKSVRKGRALQRLNQSDLEGVNISKAALANNEKAWWYI